MWVKPYYMMIHTVALLIQAPHLPVHDRLSDSRHMSIELKLRRNNDKLVYSGNLDNAMT